MTDDSFNLVDEPWIVVKNVTGTIETVSMRDIFHRAQDFRGLAGELPSQDFAVLRILLAVLYRVFNSEPLDEPTDAWGDLWDADNLPTEQIDAYLDKWHHRFNLFDPKVPFFQVADLQTAKGETRPLSLLIPDSPQEGGLFSMSRSYETISAAQAARWIIHCQAYDVSGIKSGAVGDPRVKGGKGYPIGPGWAGWLGAITVTGDDLRETLLLNLVLTENVNPNDLPVWELAPLTAAPRENVTVSGPVTLMTWPQRRIKLFRNDAGEVVSVLVSNGDRISYEIQDLNEVMSGWRHSKPQSDIYKTTIYMPRGFDPAVKLWRGINAVLPTVTDGEVDRFKPCKVLEWSATLARENQLPRNYVTKINTVGVVYGPQSASWDEIFSDELQFNVQLAASESLPAKETVYDAVGRADDAIRALSRLAGALAIAAGGESEGPSTKARTLGYAAFDQPFRNWLAHFDPQSDVEEALQQWTDQARHLIFRLGDDLCRSASPAAWVGRTATVNNQEQIFSVGKAEAIFKAAIWRALPPKQPVLTAERDYKSEE
uniref:type I-E CRISPR-associated protein Cse1/CasA n=1 Tax=Vaginimicrobium propionicum TaxID=1871034 RepID=UPI00097028D6|nr:type I-E CRISPR-associated protein Cse1/CasA [Vaginimicrobium propionicum]